MGPKGGEVFDTTGCPAGVAHSLARLGVSRCWKSWAGDKPKVFDQNDPLAFHAGLLHHSDVGGPGDL